MAIDTEKFLVTERDGLRLINPSHSGIGIGNSGWDRDTVKYRSRVETLDGETVSQGFGKFFNLGQGPDGLRIELADIAKAISKGDALATLKLDGSLLIRSVYNGKVMLRTRGSFGYEFLDNAIEMEGFKAKYPAIFDPTLFTKVSLLFEWVSPDNVIVLKYPEPDLILIGAVNHGSLDYSTISVLEFVARRLNCPLVTAFKLDDNGWAELQEALATNTEIEGFVIRLHREQDLVKVKCAPYLTKHGLKSSLTTEKLADMWFQQGCPTYATFCETFISAFDEETFIWAIGAISSMFDGLNAFNAILAHMEYKAEERAGWTRKDAALAGLQDYGQTKRFSAYMNIWEGKRPSQDLLKSILLQNCKQVEMGMFGDAGISGD